MPGFGEGRLVRADVGLAHRLLYRVMGVPDPAHYLHYRYFRRALDRHAPSRVSRTLDAGCGGGDYTLYLARRYPDAEVVGIDIDPEFVRRGTEVARTLHLGNVRFEILDLTTGSVGEGYDLIVSIDVLEHIERQDLALSGLARALRPGGIAFFHIPVRRPQPVPLSRWLSGFRAWSHDEHVAEDLTGDQFAAAVRGAGLEVLELQPTFGYWTGELATSLFALPFDDRPRNHLLQAALAPVCRVLSIADLLMLDRPRYAVAVVARRSNL